jgi:hypothetical protein
MANAQRLKEMVTVAGERPNQLVGYGLVVGLDGTGDTVGQLWLELGGPDDRRALEFAETVADVIADAAQETALLVDTYVAEYVGTVRGTPTGPSGLDLAEFAVDGDPLDGSDNAKVFVFTAESSDLDTDDDLILTVAVRKDAPAFAGTPSPSSTVDGVTYTIEGSLDLDTFTQGATSVDPITTDLPTTGTDYEYRSFKLVGSEGLSGSGFLRAKVTAP